MKWLVFGISVLSCEMEFLCESERAVQSPAREGPCLFGSHLGAHHMSERPQLSQAQHEHRLECSIASSQPSFNHLFQANLTSSHINMFGGKIARFTFLSSQF